MRVGDDASVVKIVITVDVGQHAVHDESIAFLRFDRGEFLTVIGMSTQVCLFVGRIEAFRVSVELVDDAYVADC